MVVRWNGSVATAGSGDVPELGECRSSLGIKTHCSLPVDTADKFITRNEFVLSPDGVSLLIGAFKRNTMEIASFCFQEHDLSHRPRQFSTKLPRIDYEHFEIISISRISKILSFDVNLCRWYDFVNSWNRIFSRDFLMHDSTGWLLDLDEIWYGHYAVSNKRKIIHQHYGRRNVWDGIDTYNMAMYLYMVADFTKFWYNNCLCNVKMTYSL